MFHTNQVPIIKGWINEGDTPIFVCHTKGVTENHTYIEPVVLGFSIIFKFMNAIHKKYLSIKDPFTSFPEAFEGRFGFPSVTKFYRLLKKTTPDIVIIRDRSVYSIFCYLTCKVMHIKSILYNQTPYWNQESPKKDFFHKIIYKLTPKIRMTPVLGNKGHGSVSEDSFFVPFVVDARVSPEEKIYFKNNRINILCVGKYEERKNQMMLLEILSELMSKYSFHLTIVGESSTLHHKNYYDKVIRFIEEHDMTKMVTCYRNCDPTQMDIFYKESDLFVLPSTKEFASFSQIEAMSFSVASIVSETNGTACYVTPGYNGIHFKDNDKASLARTIETLLSDRELLVKMGKNSFDKIREEYSFDKYKTSILNILSEISK